MTSVTRKVPGLALLGAGLLAATALLTAQTKVTAPKNKYSLADDVKLGKEAAAQARQEMPIMQDELVSSYTSDLGKKLVAVIPSQYQFKEFAYTFETVNVSEINAFALPGGPMFVNRGMIEKSHAEGEVVGVMAHELSHVLLRHGTANMTKADSPLVKLGQIGSVLGGAAIGGQAGAIVAQGGQSIVGGVLLRYSRDYEKQADIMGAQLMSSAGYDATDMANLFKTIEKEGSSGPQFLSDHPNPGNRVEYITKEAAALKVANPIHESATFTKVQAHLKELPVAPTSAEAAKAMKASKGAAPGAANGPGGPASTNNSVPTGRAAPPSARFATYNESNIFQISVPSNWEEVPESSSVTFSPAGGHGVFKNQSVFTHGVQVGISRNPSGSLQQATDALVADLRRGNASMGRPSPYRNASIGGRRGLQTVIDNTSEVTGQGETLLIATALLQNGDLVYVIFVAPASEYRNYQPVFQKVADSVKFAG